MAARIRSTIVGAGIAATMLTACSGIPGPTITIPVSSRPKITNPLPADTLTGDPCRALTPTQVTRLLGISAAGDAGDNSVAKTCRWVNGSRGSLVGVQFIYGWPEGLGNVDAKKDQGFVQELQPIHGYPVVAYGPVDERPTGRCGVAVGIADKAAFEADATISRSNVGQVDACVAAHRIAEAVISTLTGSA